MQGETWYGISFELHATSIATCERSRTVTERHQRKPQETIYMAWLVMTS